jgi:hypothetical protein
MKATFYKYNGDRVQCDKIDYSKNVTASELKKLANRQLSQHPVLNSSEYYNCLTTDIKGNNKRTFELMGLTHLIICHR